MINKKRWSKKHTKIATSIGLVLLIVVLLVLYFISPNAKLKRIGYSKYDIDVITEKVSDKSIKKIVEMDYVPAITSFIDDPNYNDSNLIKYMNYYLKHKNTKLKDIVSIVNGRAEDVEYSAFLAECVNDDYYMAGNVNKYIEYHKLYELAPAKYVVALVNDNVETPYTDNIGKLLGEGYYLQQNTKRYVEYSINHPYTSYKDVIAIVNSYTDYNPYTADNDVDFSKGYAMLVNKYHKLSNGYSNNAAPTLDSRYTEKDIKVDKKVASYLTSMLDAVHEQGYNVVVKRGYMTYMDLSNLYHSTVEHYGENYANSYLGKPGYNEYQTGYAVGLGVRGDSMENFGNTAAFSWIRDNAYKYGFILRYPSGKEYVTGYAYTPWHFRYVGKDVAAELRKSNLSYDEYYAYYIDQDK